MAIENKNYLDDPDALLRKVDGMLYQRLTVQQRSVIDEILNLLFENEKKNVVFSRSELGLIESLYFNKWDKW